MNLPPRITDDEVRDLPVDAGLDDLLTGLLATPEAAALGAPERRRPRWPIVAAAAASVALVVAVPTYLTRPGGVGDGPSAPGASSASTAPAVDPGPSSGPRPTAGRPWSGPSSYAVLDAPGWDVAPDSTTTDPQYGVSVTYASGDQVLDLEWTVARWHDDALASASAEQTSSTIRVLGTDARYFAYDSEQQMAYLPVVDGYGLRVSAAFTTPEVFEALVRRLRVVDEAGFSAALPPDVVRPADTDQTILDLLDGVEAPAGRIPRAAGFNSRSALAYQVVESVGCAWVEQFVAARADGDDAARAEALAALEGSRRWPVLTGELASPAWFADTVALMRDEAPDARVVSSACAVDSLSDAPR